MLRPYIFFDMRLVLFDIDGTLLWTDGAGRRAIRHALLAEMGTAGPIDVYRFDGKTDPQIVRDLLSLAGIGHEEIDARMEAVFERYLAVLEAELAAGQGETILLAGVRELLQALEPHERRGEALVGLLTGNLVRGAELKLRAAGLDPTRFAVGAFGSDSHHRPDLPGIAARRAGEHTGREFRGSDVVIVGDTPQDVECARPLGARAVAVATGFYDTSELDRAGASHAFRDLSDTSAVLTALLG
ncbi:MAG TPA: haloacid dehalogenase-like hydrolase [Gemmatimonadales bacterium]